MGDVIAWNIARWSEAAFQKHVIDMAHAHGWWVYTNPDSRRSAAGWPDLVLIREPECLFVELKKEKGRVSEAQQTILNKLALCNMETHIWYPRHLDQIHERLSNKGKKQCKTKDPQ